MGDFYNMFLSKQLKQIAIELKEHIPFTALGAVTGVIFMLIFRHIGHSASHTLFAIFHPGHVLLSAMVTASMFKLHRKQTKLWVVLIIGYVGSIGIATLSDSIMPYFGEEVLGLHIPSEHEAHLAHEAATEHGHTGEVHLGFIEEWYIVNPAAILGVLISWRLPRTKVTHAGHILISTWASSSHVLMTAQSEITFAVSMSLLAVLFLSVWLPCCISDIVFPLLFTGEPRHCCSESHCYSKPQK
jgi:TctA family transporter